MTATAKSSALFVSVLFAISCGPKSESLVHEEEEIARSIENSKGWALEKDTALLYSIISNDADLLIINPDSSQIEGIEAFREITNTFWMNPKFKATHYEVKDLRISFSRNGDVAWFYCLLDDFGKWDGRAIGWENVRWTGVLEKENGIWIIRQMHFSFP
ncbi:MAG: hypothetical protein A2161_10675 [Candidatus Schekmanbacteria bacterium RBG_13_48_7]|uniref:SnoaL-like domain-containing protein n=1 Tax=Candidatus Schekmanbacteria bacterium RBG_13_48_7 TaxID=1817878 RepID=A0A1F7RUD4_9BACT|nr:MAG: hypothetical protein A2161_10675 [Candidatus Schekmanbacteria bacterium RBG_13_48_7]